MKLLCTDTCFIKRLYNAGTVYEVSGESAKELLDYGYFQELEGPPPPPSEEDQPPGRRKKITVK